MILFKNGTVIDGSGKPAFKADILINKDKIVSIFTDSSEKNFQITDKNGKKTSDFCNLPTPEIISRTTLNNTLSDSALNISKSCRETNSSVLSGPEVLNNIQKAELSGNEKKGSEFCNSESKKNTLSDLSLTEHSKHIVTKDNICQLSFTDLSLTEKINSEQLEIIDINGLFITPGFIDPHAHSELEALRHPDMRFKVMQGITTDISGNCGVGVYPKNKDDSNLFADILGHYDKEWNWTNFSTFKENLSPGINMAFLQSHANLRKTAIHGNPNRKATTAEIETMCKLLEKSLLSGCLGFSGGIYYAPNIYASRDEYIELLKIVSHYNKIFSVHHRCEGTDIISSVKEVLDFTRETGVQLEISHLKVIGLKNQDKLTTVISMIENARKDGINVTFDAYPYNYGSTSLFSLLPPDYLQMPVLEMQNSLKQASMHEKSVFEDLQNKIMNPKGWDSIFELCGADNIKAIQLDSSPEFSGLTLSECAQKLNTDPLTALFTLLAKEDGAALMADITENMESLLKVCRHPLMCFGTDALYVGSGSHPRSCSAAVHFLKSNCIDTNNLQLEDAIYRMTGKTAERFCLKNRGLIKEGYFADFVVFDLEKLKDTATLNNPFEQPEGIKHVLVNGVFALKNEKLTYSTSGNIITA